jgi:hypothetical protein
LARASHRRQLKTLCLHPQQLTNIHHSNVTWPIFEINLLNLILLYVVGLYLKMMKTWYFCDMEKSFWNWKKIGKFCEKEMFKNGKKPNSVAMSATFQKTNDDCKYVPLSIK